MLYSLNKIHKLFSSKRTTSEYFDYFKNTLVKVLEILDSDDIDHYSVSIFPKEAFIYFKFQCLNPSFAFAKIKKAQPLSLILCSGTMGPLNLWENELNLKFDNQISVPSFISSNQVYCSILSENSCG